MAIERNFGVLRMLHRLGLREMNLVHNMEHYTGDGMYTTKNNGKGSGLTAFGRELVAELNRLGILIDLSHMAEQTIWDSIAASTQPLVTTHSGGTRLEQQAG